KEAGDEKPRPICRRGAETLPAVVAIAVISQERTGDRIKGSVARGAIAQMSGLRFRRHRRYDRGGGNVHETVRSVAGGILIGCKAVAVGNPTGVIRTVSAGDRGIDGIVAVRRISGSRLAGIGTDKGDRIIGIGSYGIGSRTVCLAAGAVSKTAEIGVVGRVLAATPKPRIVFGDGA